MNKENTLKLINSFQKLYPKFHSHWPTKDMPFYSECGDGWFQLLWDLSKNIEAESDLDADGLILTKDITDFVEDCGSNHSKQDNHDLIPLLAKWSG